MLQIPLNIKLDDAATFGNFFTGENVQLVQRLEKLASTTKDLIFIWGISGTGKSHLAQAVCQANSISGKIAAYFPLNNNLITAEAIEDLEGVDLVCLDSFESITESSEWEMAVFNLYNQLKERGKQLIVFSELSPSQSAINLPDLQSRLAAMEVYRISDIGDGSKIDFLMNSSSQVGIEMSRDVANYLVNRSDRSIPELAKVIKRLDQESLVQKRKITIPFVKQIFSF